MNTKQLIAATALITASASVFAQMPNSVGASPSYPDVSASAPAKTRAEVRMELQQAYEQGKLTQHVTPEYPTFSNFVSHRTRVEVRNEAAQHRMYEAESGMIG